MSGLKKATKAILAFFLEALVIWRCLKNLPQLEPEQAEILERLRLRFKTFILQSSKILWRLMVKLLKLKKKTAWDLYSRNLRFLL